MAYGLKASSYHPLKLSCATAANADNGSLKSRHTFLKKMFVKYASEI